MRDRREAYDWPPREQVEFLPPQQPEPRLHVHHHYNSGFLQYCLRVAAVIFVVLVLFRYPTALLMLAALVSPAYLAAIAAFAALLAFVAYRAHRAGRPF
jgi:hypothetical protein